MQFMVEDDEIYGIMMSEVIYMDSLKRFLDAQEEMYDVALREIINGEKVSHWMWYIFPQLRGLGHSAMSFLYGIDGLDEAKAYLAHPILSARLIEISEALLMHPNTLIENLIGDIDVDKLQSSMTLFATLSENNSVFHRVLDCFYDGKVDNQTLQMLGK